MKFAAVLLAASCGVLVTLANGKGPGNYSCGGSAQIRRSAFHFTDPGGCAINDPNAPFYDNRTGIYHLFYQLHVWEDVNKSDCTSGGPGPVWGHAYSRDMVTWEPLPPALWNDQWYDRCAVYTGSATILAGGPVIMYPGICQQGDPTHNCTTGTNLNLAVPSDPGDPLLTNWSKGPTNPVVNNTGRDPSGAWQTTDGNEWRTVTFDGQVFSSSDGFKSWQRAVGTCVNRKPLPRICSRTLMGCVAPLRRGGKATHQCPLGCSSRLTSASLGDVIACRRTQPGFPEGECPSLFPLPSPAKPFGGDSDIGTNSIFRSGSDGGGSNTYSNITHVFKHGGSWHDAYVVGRYDDGPPGSPGTWTTHHYDSSLLHTTMTHHSLLHGDTYPGTWTTHPMPDGGNPRTQMGTAVNVGAAYASKDFLDTRLKGGGRRIIWTWGFGLPGMLIPRQVTWDTALMQLVFSPLAEFTQLRTDPLPLPHGLNGSTLASNESRMISGSWLPKSAGNCSELIVRFEAPPLGCAARFGVGLLLGSGRNTSVFVEWQEPPTAVDVRARAKIPLSNQESARGR